MNWNTIADYYRRLVHKQSNGILTDSEQAFVAEVNKVCYGGSRYPSIPSPYLMKKLYKMMPNA